MRGPWATAIQLQLLHFFLLEEDKNFKQLYHGINSARANLMPDDAFRESILHSQIWAPGADVKHDS